jgi:hypothetical protein
MFKKLLPILFLFTGFQANAALIGNLTFDGTYISGGGRTYLDLSEYVRWDYQTAYNATQVGGAYEDFRIANTADADNFIGLLFGANADNCSAVDRVASNDTCGTLAQYAGWASVINRRVMHSSADVGFKFLADESITHEVGLTIMHNRPTGRYNSTPTRTVTQHEEWGTVWEADRLGNLTDNTGQIIGKTAWLMVRGPIAAVPEPSIIALIGLGIFGLGFARRRRQS